VIVREIDQELTEWTPRARTLSHIASNSSGGKYERAIDDKKKVVAIESEAQNAQL